MVIDPYVDDSVSAPITSDKFTACDYIFITHGHYDHILDVGKLSTRFSPKIFCSEVTAGALIKHQGVDPSFINKISVGDKVHVEGCFAEIVNGVHVDFGKEYSRLTGRDLMSAGTDMMAIVENALMTMLGTNQIPSQFEDWMSKYPQGEQLNFLFDITEGQRIYMAGTYPDPGVVEMASGLDADITLLQVLPGKTLFGIEEKVAQLAIASGCKTVIPQHHDPLFPGAVKTDLTELKRMLTQEAVMDFLELVPGEWYEF
jgi:L-ascorbate metabolism protein UlaG (beta-lactamase superfamily)